MVNFIIPLFIVGLYIFIFHDDILSFIIRFKNKETELKKKKNKSFDEIITEFNDEIEYEKRQKSLNKSYKTNLLYYNLLNDYTDLEVFLYKGVTIYAVCFWWNGIITAINFIGDFPNNAFKFAFFEDKYRFNDEKFSDTKDYVLFDASGRIKNEPEKYARELVLHLHNKLSKEREYYFERDTND